MEKAQVKMTLHGREEDIDIECVEMIEFFNSKGLLTKFSCSGHEKKDFKIMFQDHITDKQMEEFIMNQSPFMGKFQKWLRKVNEKPQYNWMYVCPNQMFAKRDLELFKNGTGKSE